MNLENLALGKKNMITTKDICWLAGILEGEGCFRVTSDNKTCNIRVSMTDSDTINKVAILWNKNVTTCAGPNSLKLMYRTAVSGFEAIQWMETLYVLMSNRRKSKIRECIDFWKAKVPFTGMTIETCNKISAGRRGKGRKTFCIRGHDLRLTRTADGRCSACRKIANTESYAKRRELIINNRSEING